MGILAGDVKLVASQVMDDVDNGGGPPTSNVIADGASNSIFNDISELDRAGGLSAPFLNSGVMFRTAASPLRPSSISVQGTLQDGTAFNVTADANGKFNGTRVKGTVD